MKHTVDYRVYYENTDAVGIMYHCDFISFCERGRSELLRHIGYPASEAWEKLNTGFVVRHLDANYLGMVKLDDLLTVETVVKTMKNTSFLMTQSILKGDEMVFTMDITIVCMGENGKPTRIPDALREKFENYQS
ncbi:MAG: thioesterase family protein [Pseudomonadota bacterium]